VAGSNIVYKEGQVVFKQGEPADGMYLIRKGELKVYLEKDGNEVQLASVGSGGMIGEMAFFDQKPRSASVKATKEAEVTKITPDDFAKLMKQIPKWFVSIMSSLSTRLRETNERLQKVENKQAGAKSPYEDVQKILHVLNLLMKDATKEGKYWALNRNETEDLLTKIFFLQKTFVTTMFDAMIEQKLCAQSHC
jgi:CRP/FNR family transcriptional regulator, cyclic AMP receptor protein